MNNRIHLYTDLLVIRLPRDQENAGSRDVTQLLERQGTVIKSVFIIIIPFFRYRNLL